MSQAPPRASRPGPSKVLPAVDFSRQSLGHIVGLRRRSVGGIRPRGRLFVCDRSEAEALRCVCQAAEASEPGASDACWRCARSRALAPRPLRPLTLLADVSDAHTHTHTHAHTHPPLVPAPACARSALHCAVLRCAVADLLPGGERAPRLLPSEQMLAYHGNARFSVESGGGHPGLGGSHYGSGRAFVSNQRLVFVTSPAAAHFVGFEVPLLQVGQGATAGAYVRRPRERG